SPACISINSLRAKCPGTRRGMQVLSFHIYCTLSSPGSAPRLAVILAPTDIKTACKGFSSRIIEKNQQTSPRNHPSHYATTVVCVAPTTPVTPSGYRLARLDL